MSAHKFIAVGCNAWGEGATQKAAIASARRNIPWGLLKGPAQVTVYKAPPSARVDGHGDIRYAECDAAPVEIETVTLKRSTR